MESNLQGQRTPSFSDIATPQNAASEGASNRPSSPHELTTGRHVSLTEGWCKVCVEACIVLHAHVSFPLVHTGGYNHLRFEQSPFIGRTVSHTMVAKMHSMENAADSSDLAAAPWQPQQATQQRAPIPTGTLGAKLKCRPAV